jgi:hypothetical protein
MNTNKSQSMGQVKRPTDLILNNIQHSISKKKKRKSSYSVTAAPSITQNPLSSNEGKKTNAKSFVMSSMKKNYFIRIQNSTRLYKITPFIQRQQRMF